MAVTRHTCFSLEVRYPLAMFSRRCFLALSAVLIAVLSVRPSVAQVQAGDPFQQFVRGNDRFGIRLLQQVHSDDPSKNAIVAPLPLTILLGAIQTNSWRKETRQELGQVFGWGLNPDLGISSRITLAAMDEPKAESAPADRETGAVAPNFPMESLWITNRLLYRSPKNAPPLLDRRFIQNAKRDFGLELVDTGDRNPTESDLRNSRDQVGELPHTSPLNQVWFSSGLHLRQSWEELFMESQPQPGEFQTEVGWVRTVQRVESVLKSFLYLKTDQFEAVALPAAECRWSPFCQDPE